MGSLSNAASKSVDILRGVIGKIVENPYLHVPAGAAVGAAAGGLLAPPAFAMLMDLLMSGKGGNRQALAEAVNGVPRKRVRLLGALAGGALGGGMTLSQHLNDPEAVFEAVKKLRTSISNSPAEAGGWISDMLPKHESADWGSLFAETENDPTIPVIASVGTLRNDPWLNPFQRMTAGQMILGDSSSIPDRISRKQLVGQVAKAGFDFTTAYAFGQGVGLLLGLPDEARNRLSKAGGLANAIYRSGIFEKG